MAEALPGLRHLGPRIARLEVETPEAPAGTLEHEATYVFTYQPAAPAGAAVSLTMPVRTRSYERGALFPVFEMNLPEGFVRRYVTERLRKFVRVNDMLFLALAGERGIGRLAHRCPGLESDPLVPEALDELLTRQGPDYFAQLVDRYLLRTTAGVSGVQPKVVVPEGRRTAILPSLIVKAAGADYPGLARNEHLCMSIARAAGLAVPDFWLSEDGERFIVRRFDLTEAGEQLGMEDFSVLTGRPGDRKYEGSYEHLFKAAALWRLDREALFAQLSISILVGNGDAHLKNFAVLYRSPEDAPRLAPLFDVVCTEAYGDRQLALTLRGSRAFPDRATLERFGRDHGIRDPAATIDRTIAAADEVLAGAQALEAPVLAHAIRAASDRLALRRPLRPRRPGS